MPQALGSDSSAAPEPVQSANESRSAIRRNVVVSYANLLRATLIGLLLTPVLIRALGETSFGAWSLIIGAAGYIGLAEAGISTAVVAKVSGAEAVGDKGSLAVLLKSARLLLTGSAALGSFVVLALSASFSSVFDVPPDLSHAASIGMLLVGGANVVGIAETSWSAALVGVGRVDVTSLIGLVLTSALAILQVALAILGASILGLASASLGIAIVSALANRHATRRMFRSLPAARADWSTVKSVLSLSGRNLLVSMSGLLAFGSDVIIVGALTGPNAAAAYAVASRAATFTRNLATNTSDVLIPSFGSAVARGDVSRLRALYRSATFLGLFISIAVAVAFLATAQPLLRLWTGTTLSGAGLTLTVLAALTVAQIPGHVAFVALMGAQRSDLLFRFSLPSAVVNLGLSIAFTIQFGVVGPALGSLLAALVVDPFLVRKLSRELLGMDGWGAYRELVPLVLPPLTVVAPLAIAAGFASGRLPEGAAPLTAAVVAVAFAVLTFGWLRFSQRGTLVAGTLRQVPVIGQRLAVLVAPLTQHQSAAAGIGEPG